MSEQEEAAIRAAPDDVRVWSIYGDSLEADGDPRGQWVGLQLAREASPNPQLAKAERAFFEANKDWLLGPELLKLSDKAVWHRGFLYSAEADSRASLEALLAHPSAKFLRAVVLNPGPTDDWSSLIEGAAWESVTAKLGAINPNVLLALPNLIRLELALPYADLPELDWTRAARLQSLTLEHATPDPLNSLLDNLPAQLRELRLERFDGRALDVLSAHKNTPKLAFVAVDGQMPLESMDALAIGQLPARLLLNQDPEPEARLVAALPGVTEVVHGDGLETAWLVLDTPQLEVESRALLTRLAQECRCEHLIAFPASVRFPSRTVTVLRLHSDDTTAALLPSMLAHALAKARQVRCGVFTVSTSNDLTRGLVFGGPVVEKPPGKRARPRVELAAAHKNEGGHYLRDEIVREMLDHMLGFDPGLDAVNRMLDAIDESLPLVLHGKPTKELPPLLTEEPAAPEPEEEEEEYEDVEQDDEQWDEPDTLLPEELPPEAEPEPSMIDVPLAQVQAAAEEEIEDEEEDEAPDAFTADEGEVWNEGPVDPHEDWEEEPVDTSEEPVPPDAVVPTEVVENPLLIVCTRCLAHSETKQCTQCREQLCEACMPIGEVCRQCAA